jgi:hypothetical protein
MWAGKYGNGAHGLNCDSVTTSAVCFYIIVVEYSMVPKSTILKKVCTPDLTTKCLNPKSQMEGNRLVFSAVSAVAVFIYTQLKCN